MRIVKLSETPLAQYLEWDRRAATSYGSEIITAAYNALCGRGLSYNIDAGVTRDRDGWLGRFVREEDIPKDYDVADVMRWALTPYVRNAASRLSRGFSA